MDILQAFILGAIQGLTEFLPVSSSGHMSLAEIWLGIQLDPTNLLTFEILIHLATALGLIIFYMKEFFELITRQPRQLLYFAIASVPVFVMGAIFAENIEIAKGRAIIIGICFIGTAIFLIGGEVFQVKKDDPREKLKLIDAILIGLAQAVALLPGVSRSGATIGSGLICGINRQKAVDFAFMLGVPAILGATIWRLINFVPSGSNLSFMAILVGTFTAFGLTFIAIPLTIRIVRAGKLYIFAIYLLALGLAVIFYEYYTKIL